MTKIMASDQLPAPKRRFQVIIHNGDTIIYDADSAFPLNTHGVLTGYEWVLIERDENDQPVIDPETGDPILNNWGQVISSPATLIDYEPWMGFTEFDSILQDCIQRAKFYREKARTMPVVPEEEPESVQKPVDDGIYA